MVAGKDKKELYCNHESNCPERSKARLLGIIVTTSSLRTMYNIMPEPSKYGLEKQNRRLTSPSWRDG